MYDLELKELGKTYKNKIAVQGINTHLGHGVYGLLGENGAGKTTLMRMVRHPETYAGKYLMRWHTY